MLFKRQISLLNSKARNLKRIIHLKINRTRIFISFRFKGGKFSIVLNERFEPLIKRCSRLILAVSIIISFIAVPFPYSAIISISLILIEQLIERVIFLFVSIALVPFPDFALWEKANFAAVVLGVHRLQQEPATVGMYFENEESGRQVFEFIRRWNYGNDEDLGDGNITISFVIDERKEKYAFFAFPNLHRPSIEKYMRNVKRRKHSAGKEHLMLIGQMIMCKLFNYNNSGLKLFRQYYTNGNLYYFLPFSGDSSRPEPIRGSKPILKNILKIIDRSKLTSKDLEKFMCEYNIDWDDNTQVPQSKFWYK